MIWKVMTGIAGLGLLSSLLMRDVPMHKKVDARWSMQVDKNFSLADLENVAASMKLEEGNDKDLTKVESKEISS